MIRDNNNIKIKDRSVKKLLKKRRTKKGKKENREVVNLGFYEFKRQLKYKGKMYGKNIIIEKKPKPKS